MYWGKYLNEKVKSNEQIRKEQKDLKNDEEKPKNIFKIGLYQNSFYLCYFPSQPSYLLNFHQPTHYLKFTKVHRPHSIINHFTFKARSLLK